MGDGTTSQTATATVERPPWVNAEPWTPERHPPDPDAAQFKRLRAAFESATHAQDLYVVKEWWEAAWLERGGKMATDLWQPWWCNALLDLPSVHRFVLPTDVPPGGWVKELRRRLWAADVAVAGPDDNEQRRRTSLRFGPMRLDLIGGAGIDVHAPAWALTDQIPCEAVTAVVGHPAGVGGSAVLASFVAGWTVGSMPGVLYEEPGRVLVVGPRDAVPTVHLPRLLAAGADRDRLFFPDRPMSLPNDVDRLADLIERHGIDVIVLDPLDERAAPRILDKLAELASGYGISIVVALRANRGASGNAVERIAGSGEIAHAVRSVLGVVPNRFALDPAEKIVYCAKSNWSAADQSTTAIGFRVVAGDTFATDAAVVEWTGPRFVNPSIALQPPDREERCRTFLASFLLDRPQLRAAPHDVYDAAVAFGFGRTAVDMARDALGIVRQSSATFPTVVEWVLPAARAQRLRPVYGKPPENAIDPPSTHPSALPGSGQMAGAGEGVSLSQEQLPPTAS